MSRSIVCTAYAKVNLTLEVLGRRPDGFHEVRSVLQTIDLHDTLTVEAADSLILACNRRELEGLDNLALRAARLLQEAAGARGGARLILQKRIPIAAGLGGGSTDAAAALCALNRLWGLAWPVDRLAPLAERLGSDVPFFLYGGTALAEGRGERITPLPSFPARWVVLAAPEAAEQRKTAALYARLKSEDRTQGAATAALARWLRAGAPGAMPPLGNAFRRRAFEAFPGLTGIWRAFLDAEAYRVYVSGTGPALFVLEADEDRARRIHGHLRAAGVAAELARTVERIDLCGEV
ncbi:MAG: 4-(cytidine 5'-diphospho)-2-C-methyl-D-erythritol kinase [Chloroflexi bacterium]|nr:4-(cytidine 5'-diphospho)-2-C-methyl-D-erythritol kinase [Chloroflexota bacterium]